MSTAHRNEASVIEQLAAYAAAESFERLSADDDLEAKLRDSAGPALNVERVLSILYAARSLETVPDVSAFARLMRADVR
jgi:hypothetical protein